MNVNLELQAKQLPITFFLSLLNGSFMVTHIMGQEQWLEILKVMLVVLYTSKFHKALYMHCSAHRLNLCVMKCCSIREVYNVMQTSDKMSCFFGNSPKRQLLLEKWIDSVLPEEN